jgi:hypothetical protein
MSLELSSIAGYAFADMSAEEKRAITEAVRRAEVLEQFYREATQVASFVEGMEADFLLHGIHDRKLLDPIHKMVMTADRVRDQLAAGIDDYRTVLRDAPRSMGFVGTFVQLLKQARTGNADAMNDLDAARDELGLLEATPPPQKDGQPSIGTLFRNASTPERRQSVASTNPLLNHAFALEESIARAARDRLAPAAYTAFMKRTRDNIALDLDAGRPLPPLSNVEAAVSRNR